MQMVNNHRGRCCPCRYLSDTNYKGWQPRENALSWQQVVHRELILTQIRSADHSSPVGRDKPSIYLRHYHQVNTLSLLFFACGIKLKQTLTSAFSATCLTAWFSQVKGNYRSDYFLPSVFGDFTLDQVSFPPNNLINHSGLCNARQEIHKDE